MNMRTEPTTFIAVTPSMRKRIEAAIESLLQFLDEIDGDADLEPSLGAPEARLPDGLAYVGSWIGATTQEHWSDGRGDLEVEEQHDAEHDPAEAGYCGGAA